MTENLSIIVPFYQGHSTLRRLLESLPDRFPVMVIDDISDPPLQREPWMRENVQVYRLSRKRYFTGAVNAGIAACKTDVLILNQDVYFDNNNWHGTVSQYRDRYGLIGERIKGTHPSFGDLGYIHGTFMYIRRDVIDKVGLLNETLYPLWGSTAEYQWRAARAGFRPLPLEDIDGFYHERKRGQKYGQSITRLLQQEPEKKSKLIQTPPLVSVIVPCYNYGRYLSDCIASLIGGQSSLGVMPGQTIQSMEIIIVDDCSTDNESWKIAQGLADLEKGIFVCQTPQNFGTAETVNFGVRRANGRYVTFLSADDMREPDSLEKLIDACEKNPHSFAYDDVTLFGGGKRIKKWQMDEYDFNRLLFKNHIHAGILYPRQAWEEVGGYPAIMRDGREDWAYNVALGLKGWCGIHVQNYGYLYRREKQGRSETNSTDEHRAKFLEKIKSLFPDAYRGSLPVACCGQKSSPKGSSAKTQSNQLRQMSLRGAVAMPNVGSQGMAKVQYTGKGMSSSWSGSATNTRYRFGEDRPIGWIDQRDLGERGKSGFLNFKDRHGNYVFELIEKQAPAKVPEPVKVVVEVEEDKVLEEKTTTAVVETAEPEAEKPAVDFPDPNDLTAVEIRELDLTVEQWDALYRAELAGKNRKGVITFVEEKLAGE